MPEKQRIAVVGAGAIGCVVGGLLHRAGEDVTLIGKKEQAEAINRYGLRIKRAEDELNIDVKAATELDFSPHIVLLAVKSQDVKDACLAIKGPAKDSVTVAMQNGLRGDEEAADVLGEENVMGCVVFFSASYLEPGTVNYTKEGSLIVGSPYGHHEKARQAGDLLSRIMKTVVTENIKGARYTKLLLNVMGNSIDAMTGKALAECSADTAVRRIAALVIKESLEVIERSGGRPASLPGMPVSVLKPAIKLPLPVTAFLLKPLLKDETQESSTLQSIKRGRPVETGYLNGEIVRMAEENNMEAPVNSRVMEIIGEVSQSKNFVSTSELAGRFKEFF